jgi:predicted dehydrogenase
MMKILIIGKGRAGCRHIRILRALGHTLSTLDTERERRPTYTSLEAALPNGPWDAFVVATPPSSHLEMLRALSAMERPILVEKPLCGLGEAVEPGLYPLASVAFNYHWHPALVGLKPSPGSSCALKSLQHRDQIPRWGLLLDHVSHDLDILSWAMGPLMISRASHLNSAELEFWKIVGTTPTGGSWSIFDAVTAFPAVRSAWLQVEKARVRITNDPTMFVEQARAWLGGSESLPGLDYGIQIQALLERAHSISREFRL